LRGANLTPYGFDAGANPLHSLSIVDITISVHASSRRKKAGRHFAQIPLHDQEAATCLPIVMTERGKIMVVGRQMGKI
jgi:hypothetical protein